MKREGIYLILLVLVGIYFIHIVYPFYQRYWAAITYGPEDAKKGKRYVQNLETIAYGLTFDDAEALANELKKPPLERSSPGILNPAQFGPKL